MALRGRGAAGDHGRVAAGALDEAGHPVAVGEGDQRAEVGARVQRVAQPDPPVQLGHAGHEGVVERALDVGAGGGGAVLAAVDQGGGDGAVRRGVEVGVVEDHERGLAAEFQVGALDGRGGEFGDPLADRGGAGEGDHRDVRVRHQVLARDPARAGDDVDHAVRDAGQGAGPGEHQRGQRGQLGRLEDDGVAGRDRREDLPGGHLERVVPGRDRTDHADRLAPHVRGVVAGVLAGRLALQVAGGPGEEGRVVDGAGDVELGGELDRLAGLRGLHPGEVGGRVGEDGGQPGERLGAGTGGGTGPLRQRGPGGGHGLVDLSGGGQGELLDDASVGRVDDLEGVTAPPALPARDVLRARAEVGQVHLVPPGSGGATVRTTAPGRPARAAVGGGRGGGQGVAGRPVVALVAPGSGHRAGTVTVDPLTMPAGAGA